VEIFTKYTGKCQHRCKGWEEGSVMCQSVSSGKIYAGGHAMRAYVSPLNTEHLDKIAKNFKKLRKENKMYKRRKLHTGDHGKDETRFLPHVVILIYGYT